jgi:hypothetical protein
LNSSNPLDAFEGAIISGNGNLQTGRTCYKSSGKIFKGTTLLGSNYQTKPNLGISMALVKTTEPVDSTEERRATRRVYETRPDIARPKGIVAQAL